MCSSDLRSFEVRFQTTLGIGGHFSTRVKIGLPHLLFTRNKKCPWKNIQKTYLKILLSALFIYRCFLYKYCHCLYFYAYCFPLGSYEKTAARSQKSSNGHGSFLLLLPSHYLLPKYSRPIISITNTEFIPNISIIQFPYGLSLPQVCF